ncbi:MAG: hypothetical protein L0216_15325 [Planctomycetales bacterium]|nr:hypothetical protein [Planctomycetales bacterium]
MRAQALRSLGAALALAGCSLLGGTGAAEGDRLRVRVESLEADRSGLLAQLGKLQSEGAQLRATVEYDRERRQEADKALAALAERVARAEEEVKSLRASAEASARTGKAVGEELLPRLRQVEEFFAKLQQSLETMKREAGGGK